MIFSGKQSLRKQSGCLGFVKGVLLGETWRGAGEERERASKDEVLGSSTLA